VSDAIAPLLMNSGYDFSIGTDYEVTVSLDPKKWATKKEYNKISKEKWKTVKYLNSKGTESSDFKGIPDDVGGVFMWVIRPRMVPQNAVSVVAYIGEAEKGILGTVKQFIYSIGKMYTGDAFAKNLFDTYSEDLFLTYYEDEKTVEKSKVCKDLNDVLSPPIHYIQGSLAIEGEEM